MVGRIWEDRENRDPVQTRARAQRADAALDQAHTQLEEAQQAAPGNERRGRLRVRLRRGAGTASASASGSGSRDDARTGTNTGTGLGLLRRPPQRITRAAARDNNFATQQQREAEAEEADDEQQAALSGESTDIEEGEGVYTADLRVEETGTDTEADVEAGSPASVQQRRRSHLYVARAARATRLSISTDFGRASVGAHGQGHGDSRGSGDGTTAVTTTVTTTVATIITTTTTTSSTQQVLPQRNEADTAATDTDMGDADEDEDEENADHMDIDD
ncbi:hypothetical protein F4777DRAFT_571798 [Nemania sp. FL0916]|nr:hypothetical protein F4777DRAFT_571798 [Nemania sp. FL0916]